MITATTHPQLANDYAAAINALDVDRYLATFADDAIAYEPVSSPAFSGKSEIQQFFENTAGLFAQIDLQFTFCETIGDEMALKWQANGTGKNGRTVTFAGIDIWKLNASGKIQTLYGYWNPAPVVAELTRS